MKDNRVEFIKYFKDTYPDSIALTRKEYLDDSLKDRELLIYGVGQEAKDLAKYLSMLNIDVRNFIDDECVGEYLCEKKVISTVDLVYENIEKIFVITAKPESHYGTSRRIFMDMGLIEDIDFTYHSEVPLTKEAKCYDVTLSYNRTMYEIEGFEVFGDVNNPDALFIVALGGSTTESTYLFIKGWAQYLSEMLKKNNISAKIYCGGIAGYSSSQELLKLIRDVIPLKPDIIISYSGLNDLYGYPKANEKIRNGRPFITHFQVEFIEKIIDKLTPSRRNLPVMHDLMWQEDGNTTVYYGLKNNKSASEVWLDNTRMMNAIATEFGIKFLSFFQPFAFNGFYNISEMQKKLYSRRSPTCIEDGYEKWGKPYEEDVRKIIAEIPKYDFICDLSRMFEQHQGVYFDASHVYERGNEIIANEIYDHLVTYIRRDKK